MYVVLKYPRTGCGINPSEGTIEGMARNPYPYMSPFEHMCSKEPYLPDEAAEEAQDFLPIMLPISLL